VSRYSKQTYEDVATVLAGAWHDREQVEVDKYEVREVVDFRGIVDAFTALFALDNPFFKPEKFEEVVYGEENADGNSQRPS